MGMVPWDLLVSFSLKMILVTTICYFVAKWVENRDPAMAHRVWLFNGVSFFVLPAAVFFAPYSIEFPVWSGQAVVSAEATEKNQGRSNRLDEGEFGNAVKPDDPETQHANHFVVNKPLVNFYSSQVKDLKNEASISSKEFEKESLLKQVTETLGAERLELSQSQLPAESEVVKLGAIGHSYPMFPFEVAVLSVCLLGGIGFSAWTLIRLIAVPVSLRKAERIEAREFEKRLPDSWAIPVEVYEHPMISGPALAFRVNRFQFQQVIVLPSAWRHWSNRQLQSVLAHEESHYRRKDLFWSHLSDAMCSLFWFHPSAWVVRSHLNRCSELACDRLAARRLGNPIEYAGHLVEVAKNVLFRSSCSVGMAKSSQVKGRVNRLLENGIMNLEASRFVKVAVSFFLIGIFVFSLLVTFANQEGASVQKSDPAKEEQDTKEVSKTIDEKGENSVSGWVESREGKGLEGILVEAYWCGGHSKFKTITYTKKIGRFQLPVPAGGRQDMTRTCYVRSLSANGMMQGGYFTSQSDTHNNDELNIKHEPAAVLTVRVQDDSPGEKAKGILVRGYNYLCESETNGHGLMTFRYPLSIRPQRIVIKKPGQAMTVVSLAKLDYIKGLGFVRKKPLLVKLNDGFTTKVRFEDLNGDPVAGVRLWPRSLEDKAKDEYGDVPGFFSTDLISDPLAELSGEDGVVTIDWLPRMGEHYFRFQSDTHGKGNVQLLARKSGKVKIQKIHVRKLKKVSFRVVDAKGKPVAGLLVQSLGNQSPIKTKAAPDGSHNQERQTLRTDADGRASLMADPYYFYYLSVAEPKLFFQTPLVIQEGKLKGAMENGIDCLIGPGALVSGKIQSLSEPRVNYVQVFDESVTPICPVRGSRFQYVPVPESPFISSIRVAKGFLFPRLLGPGKYLMRYGSQTERIEIKKGQKKGKVIFDAEIREKKKEEPRRKLKIKVVDEDSLQPLSGGSVWITRDGSFGGWKKLDRQGEASVDLVGNGNYFATIKDQGKNYGVVAKLPSDKRSYQITARKMLTKEVKLVNKISGKPFSDGGFVRFKMSLAGKPEIELENQSGVVDKNGTLKISVFLDAVQYKALTFAEPYEDSHQIRQGFGFKVLDEKLVNLAGKAISDSISIELEKSQEELYKQDPKSRAERFFLHGNQFPELFENMNSDLKKEIHSKKYNTLLAVGDPRDVMTQHYVIALVWNGLIADHLRRSRDTIFEAFHPMGLEVKDGKTLTTKEIQDVLPCKVQPVKDDVVFYVFENGKLKTKRLWSEFWDSEKGQLDSEKWIGFLDQNGNTAHRRRRLVSIDKRFQQTFKEARKDGKDVLAFFTNGKTHGKTVLRKLLEEVSPILGPKNRLFQFDSWAAGDLAKIDPDLAKVEPGSIWIGKFSADGKLLKKHQMFSHEISFTSGQSLEWFTKLIRKVGIEIRKEDESKLKKVYDKVDKLYLFITTA